VRNFFSLMVILLSAFLCVNKAYALITLDATTTLSGSGSSLTQAHTVAADANGLVVVISYWDCSGGGITSTGLTYNGTALALAKRDTDINGSCGGRAEIWYLASPATGTHNLVASFSGSTGGISGAILSLKGFNQTGQPDATANGDHLWCSNPDSDNITVATANSWVFDVAGGSAFGAPSSGQTQIGSLTMSYKTNASSGSTSMGWAYTGCNTGTHAIAAFSPGAAGNYVLAEARFTGGGGDASSTNYQVTESAFDAFSNAPMASANYALETKVGIGGAGIATINSITPGDFTKFFHDQSASYAINATSQDGDTLQYRALQDGTVKAGPQSSGTLSWTLSASDIGRHTISLEAIDPQGTTLVKQEVYVARRPTK
jgi:hypothetical protein